LRCWYAEPSREIDGEPFRGWLTERLPDRSDNLRGGQCRAHDALEAERLQEEALRVLNIGQIYLALSAMG
jgi:hypothetical protein